MKSLDVIAAEIAALKEIKPKVAHYSMMRDDHWASIDAQIEVLTDAMDEDDVYDEWPEEDDLNTRSESLIAVWWRDDSPNFEGDGSLVDGWKELVQA